MSESKFQSTRPVRGATICSRKQTNEPAVTSPPPRAGRDETRWRRRLLAFVSIHAPRAGRDIRVVTLCCCGGNERFCANRIFLAVFYSDFKDQILLPVYYKDVIPDANLPGFLCGLKVRAVI